MIASTEVVVTHFTGRFQSAGQADVTTQPIGPRSAGRSPDWYPGVGACSRSYVLAGVRAALIALVLLAVLAVIVLF